MQDELQTDEVPHRWRGQNFCCIMLPLFHQIYWEYEGGFTSSSSFFTSSFIFIFPHISVWTVFLHQARYNDNGATVARVVEWSSSDQRVSSSSHNSYSLHYMSQCPRYWIPALCEWFFAGQIQTTYGAGFVWIQIWFLLMRLQCRRSCSYNRPTSSK